MLNQLQLIAAREARSYSLEVLLVCLGWYALLAALSSGRHPRRWWLAFALAMTLALYAHLFSALVVAAQALAMALLVVLPTEWRVHARRSASFRRSVLRRCGSSCRESHSRSGS